MVDAQSLRQREADWIIIFLRFGHFLSYYRYSSFDSLDRYGLLAYARLMRHSTSGILDSPQATDHRLGMEKGVRIS